MQITILFFIRVISEEGWKQMLLCMSRRGLHPVTANRRREWLAFATDKHRYSNERVLEARQALAPFCSYRSFAFQVWRISRGASIMFKAHTIHHNVQFNRWVTVTHHFLQLSAFLYSIYACLSLQTISLVTTRTSGNHWPPETQGNTETSQIKPCYANRSTERTAREYLICQEHQPGAGKWSSLEDKADG